MYYKSSTIKVSQKVVIFITDSIVMPLTNNVIIKLNQITVMIPDKQRLDAQQTDAIRKIFKDILASSETYDVDDIESWFENEGSWKNKSVRTRVTNIAHYVQSKHEQTATLQVLNSKDDDCSS